MTTGATGTQAAELGAFPGIDRIRDALRSGDLTAAAVVEQTLLRIERAQPHLNAFRTTLADSARARAATIAAGDGRPLAGVPVALKDNAALAGEAALCGTGSPEPPADHDDELVTRLTSAGAIPVGLTQLPEFALWAVTESRWHGVTRNPWDLSRSPGGSSGGSAAAVAAGLVPLAHATDGLGSIRIPASSCGLVGLKPTHGLVPMTGPDLDHWLGMSHAGFLTRSVKDTALALDAVLPGSSYAAGLADRSPLRLAISRRPWAPVMLDPDVEAGLALATGVLADLGHRVQRRDPPYGQKLSTSATVRYLAGLTEDRHRLADPNRVERRSRQLARMGAAIPAPVRRWAREEGRRFGERMTRFFDDVDVLVTPTVPVLPARAGTLVDRGMAATVPRMLPYAGFTGPWNACGFPAVSVPAATTPAGLPVGVQLVGPPGSDHRLLTLAAALESELDWTARRPRLPWEEA